MRLLVTVAVPGPGEPLAAAVALADALDPRRVPLTLLVGPRPHPEVAAWVRARRGVGDAVLLLGTGPGAVPDRRLPEHEARLRLTATARTLDAHGIVADGFAAPGCAVSAGVRRALVAAGFDLLLDEAGVHRLDALGAVAACRADVGARRGGRPPRRWSRSGPGRADLLVVDLGPRACAALGAVDAALAAGHTPATAADVVGRPVREAVRPHHDPESWSITA